MLQGWGLDPSQGVGQNGFWALCAKITLAKFDASWSVGGGLGMCQAGGSQGDPCKGHLVTEVGMSQEVPECSALGLIALASHLEVKWGQSGMFRSALCLCHFGWMTGAILSTN